MLTAFVAESLPVTVNIQLLEKVAIRPASAPTHTALRGEEHPVADVNPTLADPFNFPRHLSTLVYRARNVELRSQKALKV